MIKADLVTAMAKASGGSKVSAEKALNALLDHLPNLRLDPDHPPPQIRGTMMRVPRHIHVRFD